MAALARLWPRARHEGVRGSDPHRVVDQQITRRRSDIAGERQALRHTPIEELSARQLKGGGDHEPEFIDQTLLEE
jgi:hypothetical protein